MVALRAYGIRTIVDLRNDDELGTSADKRHADLNFKHVPLDDLADASFWGYWASRPSSARPSTIVRSLSVSRSVALRR
jgi:hypothetical protein